MCFVPPADLDVAEKDVELTLQESLLSVHEAGMGSHKARLTDLSVLVFGTAGRYSNIAKLSEEVEEFSSSATATKSARQHKH